MAKSNKTTTTKADAPTDAPAPAHTFPAVLHLANERKRADGAQLLAIDAEVTVLLEARLSGAASAPCPRTHPWATWRAVAPPGAPGVEHWSPDGPCSLCGGSGAVDVTG